MSGIGQFSLPLVEPLETPVGSITDRSGYLIRLGDDQIGIGEATPLDGWTEDLTACRAALVDNLATTESADSLAALPALPDAPAARHALELAFLDRSARATNEPLYRYLGGNRKLSTIPVYTTVGDLDTADTVSASRDAALAGFPAIELKAGNQPIEADLDRIEAVRETVGPAIDLRVDARGAWSRDQARAAVEGFSRRGVSLLEQPLDPADLEGHAALRGQGIDIALDESLRDNDLAEVLAAEAADLLILKPMVIGGIARAYDLAIRAREAGLEVFVATTVDGAVARTAAVHLAAGLQVDQPCGLATADQLALDVGSDPAPVVDGGISVPQGAGHGVGVEELE